MFYETHAILGDSIKTIIVIFIVIINIIIIIIIIIIINYWY